MLKYQNTANVGDTIKAFDFEPMPSRDDSYLIGKVIDKGMVASNEGYGFAAYTVEVVGGDDDSRNGTIMRVPFETGMDFDGRVTVVRAKEDEDELANIGASIIAQATVKTTKTKKEAAQEIFNSFAHNGRKFVIEMFMAELNMSKAGANTYYYNCKKGA